MLDLRICLWGITIGCLLSSAVFYYTISVGESHLVQLALENGQWIWEGAVRTLRDLAEDESMDGQADDDEADAETSTGIGGRPLSSGGVFWAKVRREEELLEAAERELAAANVEART